jgi:hypothetical protein
LTRTREILLPVFFAATIIFATTLAGAETPSAPASDAATAPAPAHKWELGPFVNYGNGVGDRSSYKFLWGGFQLGRTMFPPVKAGILSGQFELSGNVMPLWQAYTPAPHSVTIYYQAPGCPTPGCISTVQYGGGTYRGVSLTPVIFRWNFATRSERLKPWFQGAGGLIYTTRKFPPTVIVPKGTPGGTSVWNFSPQGGMGLHYFMRPERSIDLGVNAVHISSASLGDKNPGVNASIQIQVGYTWWK